MNPLSSKNVEVKAKLKYLRMSPRKVRAVAGIIRGMHVQRAENQLKALPRRAALPILKLLKSAVANAEYNFRLEKRKLYVAKIVVDGGPTLKRMRARAFGRAAQILKRTSHIELILGVREKGEEIASGPIWERKGMSERETKIEHEEEKPALTSRKEPSTMKRGFEKDMGRSRILKRSSDFVRKMFRRKAI